MQVEQIMSPRSCLWAERFVFDPLPLWLRGWTSQYCCLLREPAETRVTYTDCVDCPRWVARQTSMPSSRHCQVDGRLTE